MRTLAIDNPCNRAFNRRMSNQGHAELILEGIGVDESTEAVCRIGGVDAQERGCVGC